MATAVVAGEGSGCGLSGADELPALVDVFHAVVDDFLSGLAADMRVTDDFFARRASEDLVERHADGFCFDVPEGDVDAADGAGVDALGGEEQPAEHLLPEAFGFPWIGADDDFREVVDGECDGSSESGYTDLAEAVDSGVGVDSDDEVKASRVVADGE